jgi:hypothetical protein
VTILDVRSKDLITGQPVRVRRQHKKENGAAVQHVPPILPTRPRLRPVTFGHVIYELTIDRMTRTNRGIPVTCQTVPPPSFNFLA